MRNKQIVHVGFGGYSNDLRSERRHRIDLGRDRLFRRMQRVANGANDAKPMAGTGSNARVPAARR